MANGYWIPGRWNFVGVRDRDYRYAYRDRDDHFAYRDRDDHFAHYDRDRGRDFDRHGDRDHGDHR